MPHRNKKLNTNKKMNRKEDLQQFFISANSAQNSHDFDLDNFTEQYLQRNPRSSSEYKEQCNTPVVGNSAYLCKNVNGEDAVIIAENIASVFDKLEDITPAPEYVEVGGKSITVYK